jgi:Domain of unknown function (DUF4268)
MAIFEIASDNIRKIDATTFSAAGIRELDLQRLLRKQIDIISPNERLLVIDEEFGDWEDSKRRIDLLAVDTDANLVVIELKRTEDGGHMELQAIRYAAMVSTMTFDKAVDVYAAFLRTTGSTNDARKSLLDFLDWREPGDGQFAQDVRIVLVSAEFSKELTTAVMWLNERDLDIRCVRINPYADNGRVLVDVQQVIPLPEAADYQIRIREKEQKVRQNRAGQSGLYRKFWEQLLARAVGKTALHANKSVPEKDGLAAHSNVPGLYFSYVIGHRKARSELWIDRGNPEVNKRIFETLQSDRTEIERVFGGQLSWERLDDSRGSRICWRFETGGLRSEESEWPSIQDQGQRA